MGVKGLSRRVIPLISITHGDYLDEAKVTIASIWKNMEQEP